MNGPDVREWRWTERLVHLLRTLRGWPWRDTALLLGERFREERLGLTASSLTFTTLIALVPLFTVMLAVFSAFPIFSSFQGALEKYFLQALVPDNIARPVLGALTQFAAKAKRLGTAGLVVLVFTALALMLTIDRTLNGIWRVRRPRPRPTGGCTSCASPRPRRGSRSRWRWASCARWRRRAAASAAG
jgi:membrane protein